MRKIGLIWIVGLIMVFMTAGFVAAETKNPCDHSCDGQKIGFIKYCNNDIDLTAPECECDYFDYESGHGYCPGTFSHPHGVALKLCDCDRITEIVSNADYNIKVTILTDGVYWADDNDSIQYPPSATPVAYSAITVASFLDENDMCSETNGEVRVGEICRYLDADGNLIDGTTDSCATGGDPGYSFGVTSDCVVMGKGAKTFSTKPAKLFVVNHPYILIDLPSFYYDNSIVRPGDVLKIKIEVTQSKDVCPDCDIFCTCDEVKLGVFGCYEPKCTLTFPYFVSNEGQWWNGVVVTNKGAYSGTAVFHFYDQTGHEAIATIDVAPYGIIVKTADQILDMAMGGSLIDITQAYQMTVVTDFPPSGLCIIGEPGSGVYGYNAENTCCTCNK